MNTKATQYWPFHLFLIFPLFIASCSKTTKIIPPVPVDTLTQNIYTINSAGTASPGVILTAPFPFPSDATAVVPGLLLIMDQD